MRSIAAFSMFGLLGVGVSGVASAQPSTTPPAPPPAPPIAATAEVDEASTTDAGVLEDANAGHAFLAPTALTMPRGTFSFSDDELLFAGLAYGVTDRLQLGFTFLLPVISDAPTIAVANAKFQVLRAGNFRGALTGAAIYVSENVDDGENFDEYDNSTKLLSIGAALTMCIDDACHSHFTASGSAAYGTEREVSRTTYVGSGALVLRVARLMKVVFEVDRGFMEDEMDLSFGTLAWYGVRFTSRNIGVDLGFVKNVCEECDDEMPMGLPFVSFTYRATPN